LCQVFNENLACSVSGPNGHRERSKVSGERIIRFKGEYEGEKPVVNVISDGKEIRKFEIENSESEIKFDYTGENDLKVRIDFKEGNGMIYLEIK